MITNEPDSPRRDGFHQAPSIDEVNALLSAALECPFALDVKDVVTLVVSTCIRRGELCELRWEHVDFNNRCMLAGSKAYTRRVPFGNKVLNILTARRKRQPNFEYVLGSSPQNVLRHVSRRLRALSEDACRNPVNLRSLRHTFMSRWMSYGGDVHSLCCIAGYGSKLSPFKTMLTRDQLYSVAARFQRRLEEREQ